MSNLSTNGRQILSSMDCQDHTNTRPKFQPIRVKELIFCESDDDESEEKPDDFDTESDSDDLQPLPEDSSKVSFINFEIGDQWSMVKVDGISIPQQSSKINEEKHNIKSEKNIKSEQLNHVQLNCEKTCSHEKNSQNEHKDKHITDIDIEKQLNEKQAHKSYFQSTGQHNTYKASNNDFESHICGSQRFENVSQFPSNNLQSTNMKVDILESKSIVGEEKLYHENISSNKLLTSNIESLLTSVDHLLLQTPLKHAQFNSSHPEPCFSRRNIAQTPQNKLFDISKNPRLTPVTVSSHSSQNSTKQTPLQNKTINIKDAVQTPKDSIYFTPNIVKHETPRYIIQMCVYIL